MQDTKGFPSGSVVKNLPAKHETWVWSLGREDHMELGMAMHFSILAWNIPWTEELRRLQPMGSQRVGHNWSDLARTHAGQEAKVRSGHGTMGCFQSGKGIHQGCILSPCLFNLYAEYFMWNVGLDEAQAGIKIAGRDINNFRYADDTTLMAESEEELKSLLMKVKEESEKAGLIHNIQKDHSIRSHHFVADKWGNNGNSDRLYFGGLQNHCRWWLQPWN